MKHIFFVAAMVLGLSAFAETEKTVVTVDQNGKLNVSSVASITDVTTNAVNVEIAKAKAEVAENTAKEVSKSLGGIVQNIMSNNTVIYRVGYTDSFEQFVLFGDGDKLAITKFEKVSLNGGTLVANIDYVCTVDVGVMKPLVYANSNLEGGKDNFQVLPDDSVTIPVYHAETVEVKNKDGAIDKYEGYYSITVTINGLDEGKTYFYFIKFDGDMPSGDGSSLELPNGVVGGATTEVVWGNKKLKFYKGMLLEVQDV